MNTRNFILSLLFYWCFGLDLQAQCDTNLLVNGDASAGLTGWTVSLGGGYSWAIQNSSYGSPFGYGDAFTASYEWCYMNQTIDLYALGYTAEYLNQEPDIIWSQMYKCFHNNGNGANIFYDEFYYIIKLRDTANQIIESQQYGSAAGSIKVFTYDDWDTLSGVLSNYGPGLQYIFVECHAKDAVGWAGHYGTVLDNSIVRFADTISPVAYAKDTTLYLDQYGEAYINPIELDSGSFDNGCLSSMILDIDNFDCLNVGSNIVNFIVFDADSNSDTTTTIITILDTLAPVAFAKDTILYLDGSGQAFINAFELDSGSFDNCAIDTIYADVNSFDCSDTGVNAINFTVVDSSLNSTTITAFVTIVDTTSPMAYANNTTIYLDENGLASITANDINDGSIDNCDIDSMYLDIDSFDCSDVGFNTINFTVIDYQSNSASTTAQVTVSDTLAPTVFAIDTTIYLDQFGQAFISAIEIDSGSFDNCQIDSISIDIDSFGCMNLGVNTIQLTAVDIHSNTASTTAQVTVKDSIDPVVFVSNQTIYLDESGEASVTVLNIDSGSTDNCGIDTMYIDIENFYCSDIGINTINFTVIDFDSNSVTVPVLINVLDTIAPVITCIGDTTICSPTFSYPTPSATDNCSGFVLDRTSGPQSGSTFPVGSTTVTHTVTDSSGNQASCSFTVTRESIPNQAEAGPDISLCDSTTAILDATTPSVGNGSWSSVGPAIVENEFLHNSAVNNLTLGDNQFIWTVANGVCPPKSDTVIVHVDAIPTEADAGVDIQICDQFSTELNANTPTIGIGFWTTNGQGEIADSSSANSMVSFPIGKSLYSWNIINGVCPISTDEIGIFAGETPVIDAGPDIYTLGEARVNIKAELDNPALIHWEPSNIVDNFNFTATVANILETTELIVTATREPSCISTDTIVVHVLKPIEINTVFTPNGDNINDFWNIEGSDNYPKIKVHVFNRWGSQVFVSDEGYHSKFDGTYNGELLPVSSYYYVIEFNDGVTNPIDGNLTIIY